MEPGFKFRVNSGITRGSGETVILEVQGRENVKKQGRLNRAQCIKGFKVRKGPVSVPKGIYFKSSLWGLRETHTAEV